MRTGQSERDGHQMLSHEERFTLFRYIIRATTDAHVVRDAAERNILGVADGTDEADRRDISEALASLVGLAEAMAQSWRETLARDAVARADEADEPSDTTLADLFREPDEPDEF